MKKVTRKWDRPISLAGCEYVFKQCNISKEDYSQWTTTEIFKKARELAKENNIIVEEVAFEPLLR